MGKAGRLVALVPLAILLIGVCYLSLTWSAGSSDEPEASDPIFVHPARELRLAMARAISGPNPTDPTLAKQIDRAFRLAPLEEGPFIVAGLKRLNANDLGGAKAAMDIARRRNPRSGEALYLSVDVALGAGDIRAAVESLETLIRIAPSQREVPQEALLLLTGDAEAGTAALAALSDNAMKSEALTALARSGAGLSKLLDAIRLTEAPKALATNPGTVNAVTQPLIDAGDFAGAYRVWSALLLAPPSPKALIREPGFAGTLPPPFGWDVRSGSDAFVEIRPEGLVGQTYGRRGTQLARQLLILPPGNYRLEVDAEVPNDLVEAVVLCAPATEIARTTIGENGPLSTGFTVPSGCMGQWLEIRARASDPPSAGAFHLRSIRILEAVK